MWIRERKGKRKEEKKERVRVMSRREGNEKKKIVPKVRKGEKNTKKYIETKRSLSRGEQYCRSERNIVPETRMKKKEKYMD